MKRFSLAPVVVRLLMLALAGWSRSLLLLRRSACALSIPRTTSHRPIIRSLGATSAAWNVGDRVRLPNDDTNEGTTDGIIQEVRGRGWYTVQLLSEKGGTASSRKIRGTQLQASYPTDNINAGTTETETESTTATSGDDIIVSSSKDAREQVPPPPRIINLDQAVQALSNTFPDPIQNSADRRFLEQVAHHSSIDKWVVFTDLHCSPATLPTTLQVLDAVHQAALDREAGILFLGDWWHHRGTLRVDCLNAVLGHLSTWTVPMVMIPGNHDQVTLGGHNHGLTPLENSYRVALPNNNTNNLSLPGPLIFSHPTIFGGALFVPHIRDHATLESVLQSPEAVQATAIFCHADVQGAFMNDLMISTTGVSTRMFQPNKAIYSGHFHKPHIVQRGSVRIDYLGSPYQVSLSEAQQAKSLAVLDANTNWDCIERIPLQVGCQHYRPTNLDAFLALKPLVDETTESSSPPPVLVHKGDRVVFSMDKHQLDELRRNSNQKPSVVDAHAQVLRQVGATVELRETQELPTAAMGEGVGGSAGTDVEDLSMESLWRSFLEKEVLRDAMPNSTAELLSTKGLEILAELESTSSSGEQIQNPVVKELEFVSLSVEGFGPFRKEASYPLLNRGLVLLRGTNHDEGSDSNGTGKTTLAMSALWALTGSIDPRPYEDAKVSDVINDSSKSARVALDGNLNGIPFTVMRTKSASKGSLTFVYNGEDLTTQSAKETQDLIYETLGATPQILSRTVFRGQHSINELLEATDSKLKDELSLLIPLAIWQRAVSQTRQEARVASKRVSELDGMISVRSEELGRSERRLEEATSQLKQTAVEATEAEASLEREKVLLESLRSEVGENGFPDMENSLDEASRRSDELVQRRSELVTEYDSEIQPIMEQLQVSKVLVEERERQHQNVRRQLDSSLVRLEAHKGVVEAVEATWKVDLSSRELTKAKTPTICPTCGQAIRDGQEHVHRNVQDTMSTAVSSALAEWERLEASFREADELWKMSQKALREAQTQEQSIQDRISGSEMERDNALQGIDEELQAARTTQQAVFARFAAKSKIEKQISTVKAMEFQLQARKDMLDRAEHSELSARSDFFTQKEDLSDLTAQRDQLSRTSSLMTDLSNAFGQRGIQAFVMQQAIGMLQSKSQFYLDLLSDGAQQLTLTFDSGDRISRRAFVRGHGGELFERPLGTLSGGQWRRCSLALYLGFADLVTRRGRFRPSLCVMDEPLTHLDRTGRADVGRMLRTLIRTEGIGIGATSGYSVSTIVLILQDLAAEELEEAFDCIDEVVKSDGTSRIKVDERTA